MNPIIQSPSAKKYVLNMRKGNMQEVVFQLAPRKKVSRAKGAALRAGVLSRMVNLILNNKRKNQPK
jgi:hypothetical protein